jgi:hypothetical protein
MSSNAEDLIASIGHPTKEEYKETFETLSGGAALEEVLSLEHSDLVQESHKEDWRDFLPPALHGKELTQEQEVAAKEAYEAASNLHWARNERYYAAIRVIEKGSTDEADLTAARDIARERFKASMEYGRWRAVEAQKLIKGREVLIRTMGQMSEEDRETLLAVGNIRSILADDYLHFYENVDQHVFEYMVIAATALKYVKGLSTANS